MSKKIIVANWKMSPQTLAEAEEILDVIDNQLTNQPAENFNLIICPPFIFLEEVGKLIQTSRLVETAVLGAQDISFAEGGAWTGEVSGSMLKRLGVKYVIAGHSERRLKLGESNDMVDQKIKIALKNNLIPIVCLGEETREGDYKKLLIDQMTKTFEGIPASDIERCLICYEPVWAISTNLNSRPDTPESAVESIKFIKNALIKNYKLKTENLFLYGGSVNSSNFMSFISKPEINGVLVGAASVNKEEFVKILSLNFNLTLPL